MSARHARGLALALLALASAVLVAALALAVMNGFRAPWDWGTRATSASRADGGPRTAP